MPIGGPTSWAGREIGQDASWTFEFPAELARDLHTQMKDLEPAQREGGMAAVAKVGRHLDGFRRSTMVESVRNQLVDGCGLALIRGLPVDGLTVEQCELLVWCLGTQLGIPIHQNPEHDLIVHVADEGKDWGNPSVRAYETAESLNYHSDSSDIVGLLCVRPALSGGVSTVVSASRVHDELIRRDPDAAALLYEPWWHFNPASNTVVQRPICVRHGNRLFTHYGRRYLDLGAQDPRTPAMTDEQRKALDLYDAIAASPELVLNMDFRPGDLQLLNNYTTMHARTAYIDQPEPERRRLLLRIWLVLANDLEIPVEFGDIGIIPRSAALAAPT